jgi:hypothetical protein
LDTEQGGDFRCSLRIPPALHVKLKARAEDEKSSLNSLIVGYCEMGLAGAAPLDTQLGMVRLALREAGADASLIASVLSALRPAPASSSSAQEEGGEDD